MFCAPDAVPRITLTRPSGQDQFHPERSHVGVAVGRIVGAVDGRDVDDRAQEEGGECGSDELHDDVAGHPLPREVTAQGEGDADRRVQVGTGDLAHEQDDGDDRRAPVPPRQPVG